MEFIELSIKDLKETTKKLYNKVNKNYKYDLVIFVARGSYLIGEKLAHLNEVPLLEIKATRKGGKLKKIVSPLLVILPSNLKIFLRKKEIKSNYHKTNSERQIEIDEKIWNKYKKCRKILLVDDSVDTGYSIKFAKEKIEKYFKDAELKIAVYNVFDKSKEIVDIDYTLYKNTIIKGPWSNDSKEHSKYLSLYKKWREK